MSKVEPAPYELAHMDQVFAQARENFYHFVNKSIEILEEQGGNKALTAAIVRTHIDMAWGYEVARSIASVALVELADRVLRYEREGKDG